LENKPLSFEHVRLRAWTSHGIKGRRALPMDFSEGDVMKSPMYNVCMCFSWGSTLVRKSTSSSLSRSSKLRRDFEVMISFLRDALEWVGNPSTLFLMNITAPPVSEHVFGVDGMNTGWIVCVKSCLLTHSLVVVTYIGTSTLMTVIAPDRVSDHHSCLQEVTRFLALFSCRALVLYRMMDRTS